MLLLSLCSWLKMNENPLLNRHVLQFSSLNKEDLVDWIIKFLPLHPDRSLRKWIHSDVCLFLNREERLRNRCHNLCNSTRYTNFLNCPFKFSFDKLHLFYEKDKKQDVDRKPDSKVLTDYFPCTDKMSTTFHSIESTLLENQPVVLVKRLSWRTIEKKLEEAPNDASKSRGYLSSVTFSSSARISDSKTTEDNVDETIKSQDERITRSSMKRPKLSKRKSLSSKNDLNVSKKFDFGNPRFKKTYVNRRKGSLSDNSSDGKVNEEPCCSKISITSQIDKKNVLNSPNRLPINDVSVTCLFCKQSVTSHPDLQDLISIKDISVHEKCMYFASGLSQSFQPECALESVNNTHLNGFIIKDILKEVKRGSKLSCSGCFKKGACSGCVIKNCKRGYHLPCALNHGAICIFDGNFPLYCSYHRPKLNITRWYPEFTSATIMTKNCCICLDELTVTSNHLDHVIIHGQCCSECWMHRDCANNFARSAGLHHIKCPLCNDKDIFLHAIKQIGVWIPDRDAAWELEEGAFQDLYNSTDPSCSVENCLCNRGRDFYDDNVKNKWYTLRCAHCLIIGAHQFCLEAQHTSSNILRRSDRFVCEACKSLDKDSVTQ